MCLVNVMSRDEQKKFLKTVADPMICWKAVRVDVDKILRPLHQYVYHTEYHAGVNVIECRVQSMYTPSRYMKVGAHFFRHRKYAVAAANFEIIKRRIIRCIVNKKDIDVIGYTDMFPYEGCGLDDNALTIIAHKATFAKTVRKVS